MTTSSASISASIELRLSLLSLASFFFYLSTSSLRHVSCLFSTLFCVSLNVALSSVSLCFSVSFLSLSYLSLILSLISLLSLSSRSYLALTSFHCYLKLYYVLSHSLLFRPSLSFPRFSSLPVPSSSLRSSSPVLLCSSSPVLLCSCLLMPLLHPLSSSPSSPALLCSSLQLILTFFIIPFFSDARLHREFPSFSYAQRVQLTDIYGPKPTGTANY